MAMFDYAGHGLIASRSRRPLPGAGSQTIGLLLDRQLQEKASHSALVGRSARYTYAELDGQVRRAARVFHELGVRKYDRIAACLPNDVDIVIAFLAAARLGAIWVGVNRPLAALEKAFILQDSGACLYLTDGQGQQEIAPQQQRLSDLRHVLCVNNDDLGWRARLNAVREDAVPALSVDPFEPAAIAYTSGTTGQPKGAVHSHHNLLLPGAIQVCESHSGADCPQGVMLPLTILNLMVLAPLTAFQAGTYCVCMDSLKPADIARWVRDERVGHFASVPTVIQDLLTAPEVDPGDLATLGQPDIGGAGIPESFQHLYRERFGRGITVAYGMTEAPTIIAKTSPDEVPQDELCGRPVEQVEVLIVNAVDEAVAAGEIGEICVRSAPGGRYAGVYTTMLGYWNRAEATAEALANGMYHTGDVGLFDEQGRLFIRGRQNDLIIRGGANVYPAEVERVLAGHPALADAAVLGVPDERLGQRVVAVVEGAESDSVSVAKLQDYCRAYLARYKVPEAIVFVDGLPRNAMNKVIKPELLHLFL
ncbi:MAG: AMP-binding protein [Halioglobus sp.]|nr:AMP-binding protein [Halioglobus sp.]